jgi:hypothetical protein
MSQDERIQPNSPKKLGRVSPAPFPPSSLQTPSTSKSEQMGFLSYFTMCWVGDRRTPSPHSSKDRLRPLSPVKQERSRLSSSNLKLMNDEQSNSMGGLNGTRSRSSELLDILRLVSPTSLSLSLSLILYDILRLVSPTSLCLSLSHTHSSPKSSSYLSGCKKIGAESEGGYSSTILDTNSDSGNSTNFSSVSGQKTNNKKKKKKKKNTFLSYNFGYTSTSTISSASTRGNSCSSGD